MAIFVITDGKGSFLRRDIYSGRYVQVRERRQADEFDQRTKAANILKSSVTKEIKKKFHIICETSSFSSMQDLANVITKERQKTRREEDKIDLAANTNVVYESKIDDILESLTSAQHLFQTIKDRAEKLNEMLSITNSEINDILHYIEFTDLNLYQAWLIYKLLRDTRRKRRKIKDELLVLEKIEDCKVLTEQVVTNALKSAEGLDSRKYDARALNALFNKGE